MAAQHDACYWEKKAQKKQEKESEIDAPEMG